MSSQAYLYLAHRLWKLHSEGSYSDLTITCGLETSHVHKAIVCTGSGFFAGAVRFTVGKEAADSTIHLPDDDPATIKSLVQYLYTADYGSSSTSYAAMRRKAPYTQRPLFDEEGYRYTYDFPHTCQDSEEEADNIGCWFICPHHVCGDECDFDCKDFVCATCNTNFTAPRTSGCDASQMLFHSKMYTVGDKYGVLGLQDLAREKFARCCQVYWNDEQFPVAAHHVWSTTPEENVGLREVVCKTVAEHKELLKKPEVERLLDEFHGLAKGILMAQAAK